MNTTQPSIIQFVANELDVPNEAYDKAKKRYESIGEWLCRPDSRSSAYSPHVHSQGSFRLGTAIQTSEGFDLDMSIRLEESISPSTHSQADLKELVGEDLEEYRKAHGIKKKLDEKARCWRLEYADSYHFHIDGVPCIPDSDERRQYSERAIREFLEDPHVAAEAAQHAASITDVNEDSYRDLGAQWPPSNPEGYAKWFESRMRLAQKLLAERTFQYSVASVDDLPAWQWRVPLQQAIQILKRHRDIMYEHDEDRKPISIIITTLAARAYTGESDLEAALASILEGMERGVNSSSPYVQNPVWPEEDFADKWDMPEHAHLRLREHFYKWLYQARKDFELLQKSVGDFPSMRTALKRFGVVVVDEKLEQAGFRDANQPTFRPSQVNISGANKPWLTSFER